MKRMAEAKLKYDSIPIPDELSERIMMEIEKAGKTHHKQIVKMRRSLIMKRTAVAAAAVLLTVGVNSSEAFAQGAGSIPVIGTLARVVTFRSYETETENAGVSVDIPSVEMISSEMGGLEKEVNEEILAFCTQYADEAVSDAAEYRQAFLETGGTEEEWAQHDVKIKVWYEVKSQTDRYLSLAVMGNNNWNNSGYEARYYNFDIEAGRWVTICDILDDAHIQPAEESIRKQMKQREKETGMEFWGDEWQGIDKKTKFYMNSEGNPVIVFEKYEIAPGAAGVQEFEVSTQMRSGSIRSSKI